MNSKFSLNSNRFGCSLEKKKRKEKEEGIPNQPNNPTRRPNPLPPSLFSPRPSPPPQPARSLTPLRPSARPSRVTCAPPPLLAQRAAPRSSRATRSPPFADHATPPVGTFSFPSFSSSPRPNSSAHATAPLSLRPCAVDRPSPKTH